MRKLLAANIGEVFSTQAMREVAKGNFNGRAAQTLTRLTALGALTVPPAATYADAIAAYHRWMVTHHRNEYVHKNALANKTFLKDSNLTTATMLTEFRVGDSVADCVIVNSCATVYEIKTELDTPARLLKQLDTYVTAFPRTVVVTDVSLINRYTRMLSNRPTGLVVLTGRGDLEEIIPSRWDVSHLSVETMFKALRKPEYTQIAAHFGGTVPTVPNTQHFRLCFSMVQQVKPSDFHEKFSAALKKRHLPAGLDNPDLETVRHVCFKLSPKPAELANIVSWLKKPLPAVETQQK